MSTLPAHFATYRTATHASPGLSNRKTCTGCKAPKSMYGGIKRRREGSHRFDWFCAECARSGE